MEYEFAYELFKKDHKEFIGWFADRFADIMNLSILEAFTNEHVHDSDYCCYFNCDEYYIGFYTKKDEIAGCTLVFRFPEDMKTNFKYSEIINDSCHHVYGIWSPNHIRFAVEVFKEFLINVPKHLQNVMKKEKERHIKEIQNAANVWIMKQLIVEERIHACEERYKNLLYYYNEKHSS